MPQKQGWPLKPQQHEQHMQKWLLKQSQYQINNRYYNYNYIGNSYNNSYAHQEFIQHPLCQGTTSLLAHSPNFSSVLLYLCKRLNPKVTEELRAKTSRVLKCSCQLKPNNSIKMSYRNLGMTGPRSF